MAAVESAEAPNAGFDNLVEVAATILRAAGTSAPNAALVADHLVEAQSMEHASHGLRLLDIYVDRLIAGKVSGTASPAVLEDTGVIVRISGNMAFGQVVGEVAADLGAKRAREHGLCMVAVKDSSQFGRNGRWPEIAARQGIASIHFAHGLNASVVPYGAQEAKLGTNPIAMGVPGPGGDDLIFDFSVAEIAANAVKLAFERGEKLHAAAVMGPDGPTDDPAVYVSGMGGLLPFGGFKGYGLAIFAEVFGGVIAAGERKVPGINSMLSFYFDPARFGEPDAYGPALAGFIANLRSARTLSEGATVPLPGDRSRAAHKRHGRTGIPLAASDRKAILSAASKAGAAEAVRSIYPPLFA